VAIGTVRNNHQAVINEGATWDEISSNTNGRIEVLLVLARRVRAEAFEPMLLNRGTGEGTGVREFTRFSGTPPEISEDFVR
jgi:hypothetical protein